MALDDSNRRRTLALYLLARVVQVMYSIVMRPESLPKSYQDLIQKTGPVAKPVYKAVRDCCRGGPVDVASISAYLSSRGKLNVMKLEEFPSIIPCSIIHPETDSCLGHNAKAASATFRKTFPLYFFPDICTICCSAPTEDSCNAGFIGPKFNYLVHFANINYITIWKNRHLTVRGAGSFSGVKPPTLKSVSSFSRNLQKVKYSVKARIFHERKRAQKTPLEKREKINK
ncbi:hypothetical protein KPL71_012382 [Citrus sinensis]|uniref:Uncharacterized protein n=1 Tax=Citrus sinensis TaxID=2711 RepID=A0ACB8LAV5_CITSI|nr:hypothetical protein KPL71_012382 [Citrus sinensis]